MNNFIHCFEQPGPGCFSLHYICLGCPSGCCPRHQIFCKTSKLSTYFYIQNAVPDLLLCLGVFKYRAPLAGEGGHLPPKNNITMDLCLCGAILNLKAFCFGAIPDKMIELIVYGSVPQSRQTWQWLSDMETKLLEGLWLLAKKKCLRWIHAYVVQF